MNRVRKERKACYVYRCELCSVTATAPDLFRAMERQQMHERTLNHAFAELIKPFRDFAECILRRMVRES